MLSRMLKAVGRSQQIRMNQVIWIAIIAGMHARLGGCFDDKIDRSDRREIGGRAHVAMGTIDAACTQSLKREFRSATFQIVKGDNRRGCSIAFERKRNVRADKSGPTGDKNALSHVLQNSVATLTTVRSASGVPLWDAGMAIQIT